MVRTLIIFSIALLPARGMADSSEKIGGGAINEKIRTYNPSKPSDQSTTPFSSGWDPTQNISQFLHAIVGLDRYPNYFSRFQNVQDVVALENALKQTLEKVEQQKNGMVKRRNDIADLVHHYNKLKRERRLIEDGTVSEATTDTDLSLPRTWSELKRRNVLHENAFKVAYQSMKSNEVGDIINGSVNPNLSPSLLEDFMEQEMFDVYSFPLLSVEFCRLIRQTVRDLTNLCESVEEFNHIKLGCRPVDLDMIGLGWINDMIFNLFIRPMTIHLFAKSEQLESTDSSSKTTVLDWRHGYVAGYSVSPAGMKGATREKLVCHTDDSEVTLNCCLGGDYNGGHVEFYGLRGSDEEGQLAGIVKRPNVGAALLHSGRHLHGVSAVTKGDRYALIIWSRSWGNLRRSLCPCCYLNRRQDNTCICAKRWN